MASPKNTNRFANNKIPRLVAVGLIGLWIAKFLSRRREAKERAQAKY